MKSVIPREQADQDIDAAIHYYAQEAPHIIDDLIGAFADAYARIGEAPKTGSPRYASLLKIPGLRSALVDRFPYVVFYIEHTRYIDVIRVLHQHRDFPSILLNEG